MIQLTLCRSQSDCYTPADLLLLVEAQDWWYNGWEVDGEAFDPVTQRYYDRLTLWETRDYRAVKSQQGATRQSCRTACTVIATAKQDMLDNRAFSEGQSNFHTTASASVVWVIMVAAQTRAAFSGLLRRSMPISLWLSDNIDVDIERKINTRPSCINALCPAS